MAALGHSVFQQSDAGEASEIADVVEGSDGGVLEVSEGVSANAHQGVTTHLLEADVSEGHTLQADHIFTGDIPDDELLGGGRSPGARTSQNWSAPDPPLR